MLCYLFRHPDELSMGLSHLLLCTGPDSKAVYRRMYVILKGQGVGAGRKTFVFPELIRQRFAHHVPVRYGLLPVANLSHGHARQYHYI